MLFSSVNEIKTILPIGAGNDFNRLKPHIENAENRYIKPLLGVPMYEELREFYETEYPQEPTEVQELTKKLLEKVQFATIHLAYFAGFDFLNATVSDAGFQRIETERTKGLYKYQEDAIKVFFSESGFNALDDVLVFLEENIELFHEFKNHENYTIYKKAFLPSVKVVENIPFNIHGSRLIFLALQPAIAYIEDTAIRTVLGEEIYAEIKTGMQNDEPVAKVKDILPFIRKPLIYLASAMLMEETGATLYEKGLFFEENNDQQRSQKTKGPSSEERIAALVSRNRNIGNNYLEMLKSHLNANWENYPGQTGSVYTRDNTGKRTFFA
jgi:hypothetical protein